MLLESRWGDGVTGVDVLDLAADSGSDECFGCFVGVCGGRSLVNGMA